MMGRVVGWKRGALAWCLLLSLLLVVARPAPAADLDRYLDDDLEAAGLEQAGDQVADPLEGLNRAFFAFNDTFYFVLLKPLARLYGAVVPRDLRLCVRNFLANVATPVRVVNNLLQGKPDAAGVEVTRFLYNTTVGVGGLADAAATDFGLVVQDEDLGQTFGRYGMGPGWYFCWPFLGPSNLRDSLGLVGDLFLHPLNYLDLAAAAAVRSGEMVNRTSLSLGEYESFKEAALDPYVAMREAYDDYRRAKIEDRHADDGPPPMQPTARAVPAGGGPSRAAAPPAAVAASLPPGYAVAVLATIDRQRAEAVAARLRDSGSAARVVLHPRGDYLFYGVEVPVAGSFRQAKEREMALAAGGFPESRVVAHGRAGRELPAIASRRGAAAGKGRMVMVLAATAKRRPGGDW